MTSLRELLWGNETGSKERRVGLNQGPIHHPRQSMISIWTFWTINAWGRERSLGDIWSKIPHLNWALNNKEELISGKRKGALQHGQWQWHEETLTYLGESDQFDLNKSFMLEFSQCVPLPFLIWPSVRCCPLLPLMTAGASAGRGHASSMGPSQVLHLVALPNPSLSIRLSVSSVLLITIWVPDDGSPNCPGCNFYKLKYTILP